MCLCGILSTETNILPETIVAELNNFFDKNVEWLEQAYQQISSAEDDHTQQALQTLSLLEGAMLICTSKKDIKFFDLSTQLILENVNKS